MAKAKKEISELEMAIQLMPIEKKNKLLLRLVKKDDILQQQVIFENLGDDTDRKKMEEDVRSSIEKYLTSKYVYETPGEIMMEMRGYNARITEYVKITKDKAGEIDLTLTLLAKTLKEFESTLRNAPDRAVTFAPYFVRRLDFVLKKIEKMHEDYHMEYRERVNLLLHFVHTYIPTKLYVKDYKIPKKFG